MVTMDTLDDLVNKIDEQLKAALNIISSGKSLKRPINNNEFKTVEMIFEQITTFSTIIKENANLISMDNLNKKFEEVKTFPQSTPSFADIVKLEQKVISNKSSGPVEKTLIISAKENTNILDLQQQVHGHIRAMRSNKNKTKINKIIKSRNGIIIKTPSTNDLDILIAEFQKQDIINNNAKIYQAKAFDPTIVLKKVDKMTDHDNISQILCEMNPELEGCQDDIKLLFNIKTTTVPHHDLVLRVSPKVYNIIKKLNHVHTDLEVVQIRDRVLVRVSKSSGVQNLWKHRPSSM
uniref:Uncharacterized protein LOC113795536 n=1 Tax=Dermatophagoides pteronyssinus TaxID=6956 RepID=A0A6P6Y9A3_DERPT|nr:uncharacterized protein LOC113795536 [Dermatophagoides pteronyssinus]